MDENMTCNPTCYEMDKDSWSLGFYGETTSKGLIFRMTKPSQQISVTTFRSEMVLLSTYIGSTNINRVP
jgi:hypothetical protein